MKSIKPLVNSIVLSILFFQTTASAEGVSTASCQAALGGGASAITVPTVAMSTLYNVFPIRLAGVPIVPAVTPTGNIDPDPLNNVPLCTCIDPIPRVGITLALWEPMLIAEPTAIPFCSPTIGTSIPVQVGPGMLSFGQNQQQNDKHTYTYQVHTIKYPIFALLGLFLDFVCLQTPSGMDFLYLSEFDPLWQSDIWAAILAPESFLVANPVAEASCMVDSIAAALGFPLDPMFWCFGSWNGAYPLTQTVKGTTTAEAQGAVTGRMLFKLHRQLMLWGSVGNQGVCGMYPMPIMKKSQYQIFPIYPVPWIEREPIGRTGLVLWGTGQDNPVNMHATAWMVYRHRDCCAL